MYKRQMTLQRVVCILALIASALLFVYSLGLMTDLYDALYSTMMNPNDFTETEVTGSIILYDMQPFNRLLLRLSIGMLLLSALLFITNTHSRRRYYLANYVMSVVYSSCAIALAIWSHLQLEAFKLQYQAISFEELEFHAELWETPYIGPNDTFWFDAHYAVCAFFLLAALLMLVNMFYKVYVMHAESLLIGTDWAATEESRAASTDRLRFIKNNASSRLLILAIVFDALFFISIYRSDVGKYYYQYPIGITIIVNLVFLLACFLASEGVKNYKRGYSYLAFFLALVQIAQIFYIPMNAHSTTVQVSGQSTIVMADAQFHRVVFYLIASAVCLVVGGIINLNKSRKLAAHEASIAGKA